MDQRIKRHQRAQQAQSSLKMSRKKKGSNQEAPKQKKSLKLGLATFTCLILTLLARKGATQDTIPSVDSLDAFPAQNDALPSETISTLDTITQDFSVTPISTTVETIGADTTTYSAQPAADDNPTVGDIIANTDTAEASQSNIPFSQTTKNVVVVILPDQDDTNTTLSTIGTVQCNSPNSVVAQNQPNPLEYSYEGVDEPILKYVDPPFLVDPADCIVKYSCDVLSGARTDLCDLDEDFTKSSFDTQTGVYSFASSDKTGVPPGEYIFAIQAQVGDKSAATSFKMILTNPCPTTPLKFTDLGRFQDQTHYLQYPKIVTDWNQQSLIQTNLVTDCGPIKISFMQEQDDGTLADLDPTLFIDSRATDMNSFVIQSTNDLSKVGKYVIHYSALYAEYPKNEAQNIFKVTIVDACDVPFKLTPSKLKNQEYVITDLKKVYVADPFTSDPTWCNIKYSIEIQDADLIPVVSFDDSTITFEFFEDSNIGLAGLEFVDYQIKLVGKVGISHAQKASADFTLRLLNPCLLSTYVTITPFAIEDGLVQYSLYRGAPFGQTESHPAFQISTQPISHNLCGNLRYQATLDDVPLSQDTAPVSYQSNSITVYSEDFSFIGTHIVKVKAKFQHYQASLLNEVQIDTKLIVLDPCNDPESLSSSSQTDPAAYRYTGDSPAIDFLTNPFLVEPSICPIKYTCSVLSGPVLTLCDEIIGNAMTQISFDQATGAYFFASIDPITYPPGDYVLDLNGRVGIKSASTIINVKLEDPCPTATITLNSQKPFENFEYGLQGPAIDKQWDSQSLGILDTQVDCGPLALRFFLLDSLNVEIPLDPTLFIADMSNVSQIFRTGPTSDVSKEGVYNVRYEVFLVNFPVTKKLSSQSIDITITDPCSSPISITPAALSTASYTITKASQNFQIPPFTSVPTWCNISYTYQILEAGADTMVSFDATSRKFTLSYINDLSPLQGEQIQKSYTVRVFGEVGIVQKKQTFGEFKLKVNNPCADPDLVKLFPISDGAQPDKSYTLYDLPPAGLTWIHKEFYVNTQPFMHNMCGPIAYKVRFQGQENFILNYNALLKEISLYSEDRQLIGQRVYSIQGYLVEYPTILSEEQAAKIKVIDPCLNPTSITSAPQNDLEYMYLTAPTIHTMTGLTTWPPQCPIKYTCQQVNTALGPNWMPCEIAGVSTFTQNGSNFSFVTPDIATYPPGEYEYLIEAETGVNTLISTQFTLKLTLIFPCPHLTLQQVSSDPFRSMTIKLREQERPFRYDTSDLISVTSTFIDCGPLVLDFYQGSDTTLPLDPFLFTSENGLQSGKLGFIAQNDVREVGIYPIGYKVYLQNFPQKSITGQTFIIQIVDPCDLSLFQVNEMPRWCGITTDDTFTTLRMPGWMNEIDDYWTYVGQSLYIPFGSRYNDEGDLMDIAVFFGAAARFCKYEPSTNSVQVNGDLTTINDAQTWVITVEARFSEESDLYETYFDRVFSTSFNLQIVDNGQKIDFDGTQIRKDIVIGHWNGLTIDWSTEAQKAEKVRDADIRSEAYIVQMSPLGELIIGFTREMEIVDNLSKIETTQIALELEKLDNPGRKVNLNQKSRRNLEDIIYVKDDRLLTKTKKLQIVDSLDIKIFSEVKEEWQKVNKWEVKQFTKDFMKLNIDYAQETLEESKITTSQINVKIWNTDFFIDTDGVQLERGFDLNWEIGRPLEAIMSHDIDYWVFIIGLALGLYFVFCAIMVLAKRSLAPVWMFLNAFNLIIFVVLFKLDTPPRFNYFLSHFMHSACLALPEAAELELERNYKKLGQQAYEQASQYPQKSAYSPTLHDHGFKLHTLRAMPALLSILAISILLTIILIILVKICRKSQGKRNTSQSCLMRFLYLVFLQVLSSILVTLVTQESVNLDGSNLSDIVACVMLLLVPFMVFMVWLASKKAASEQPIFEKGSFFKPATKYEARPLNMANPIILEILQKRLEDEKFDSGKKESQQNFEIAQESENGDQIISINKAYDTLQRKELKNRKLSPNISSESNKETIEVSRKRSSKRKKRRHGSISAKNMSNPNQKLSFEEYEGGSRVAIQESIPTQRGLLQGSVVAPIPEEKSEDEDDRVNFRACQIREEARLRAEIAHAFKVKFEGISNLQAGLKKAHPTEVIISYPIVFLLRRAIYACAVVLLAQIPYIGISLILCTCLLSMAFLLSQFMWNSALLTRQHAINELFCYTIFLLLAMHKIYGFQFSAGLAWLDLTLVYIVVAFIIYNITELGFYLAHDLYTIFRRQYFYLKRMYRIYKRNKLRQQVGVEQLKKKKKAKNSKRQKTDEENLIVEKENDFDQNSPKARKDDSLVLQTPELIRIESNNSRKEIELEDISKKVIESLMVDEAQSPKIEVQSPDKVLRDDTISENSTCVKNKTKEKSIFDEEAIIDRDSNKTMNHQDESQKDQKLKLQFEEKNTEMPTENRNSQEPQEIQQTKVVKESEENAQSGDFEEAMHERSHENSRAISPQQAVETNFRQSPKQSVIAETSNDDTGQDGNFQDVSLIQPENAQSEKPEENQVVLLNQPDKAESQNVEEIHKDFQNQPLNAESQQPENSQSVSLIQPEDSHDVKSGNNQEVIAVQIPEDQTPDTKLDSDESPVQQIQATMIIDEPTTFLEDQKSDKIDNGEQLDFDQYKVEEKSQQNEQYEDMVIDQEITPGEKDQEQNERNQLNEYLGNQSVDQEIKPQIALEKVDRYDSHEFKIESQSMTMSRVGNYKGKAWQSQTSIICDKESEKIDPDTSVINHETIRKTSVTKQEQLKEAIQNSQFGRKTSEIQDLIAPRQSIESEIYSPPVRRSSSVEAEGRFATNRITNENKFVTKRDSKGDVRPFFTNQLTDIYEKNRKTKKSYPWKGSGHPKQLFISAKPKSERKLEFEESKLQNSKLQLYLSREQSGKNLISGKNLLSGTKTARNYKSSSSLPKLEQVRAPNMSDFSSQIKGAYGISGTIQKGVARTGAKSAMASPNVVKGTSQATTPGKIVRRSVLGRERKNQNALPLLNANSTCRSKSKGQEGVSQTRGFNLKQSKEEYENHRFFLQNKPCQDRVFLVKDAYGFENHPEGSSAPKMSFAAPSYTERNKSKKLKGGIDSQSSELFSKLENTLQSHQQRQGSFSRQKQFSDYRGHSAEYNIVDAQSSEESARIMLSGKMPTNQGTEIQTPKTVTNLNSKRSSRTLASIVQPHQVELLAGRTKHKNQIDGRNISKKGLPYKQSKMIGKQPFNSDHVSNQLPEIAKSQSILEARTGDLEDSHTNKHTTFVTRDQYS